MKTFKDFVNEDELEEDGDSLPSNVNSAGSGNIAGIGVPQAGNPNFAEPGVDPVYQRARKQLKLMNGPAVDPRMFRAKIFGRKPPVMENEKNLKAQTDALRKKLKDEKTSVLMKHGYKPHEDAPNMWVHPKGHSFVDSAGGSPFWTHYLPSGEVDKRSSGATDLDDHLSKTHHTK